MKNESLGELEKLQTLARKKGFVCMLWHIDDVQDYYDVSDEEALELMEYAIYYNRGAEYISSSIDNYFKANVKKRKG
mgnify:CR=1 FL=1